MLVKRLRLSNYRQYEERTIEIGGTLIAVTGHNGVGKSNLLKGIQFALTGEVPGSNKADLLRWGSKTGLVELWFEHDGIDGHIARSVDSNKVTLEYDGVTTSGITNVAREMKERLKFDKDLIRQAVFIAQTEVDAIISSKTDKRERELAFQRLLGIDAAKIHKTLTDWIYANDKGANYDIQLTEASRQLEAMTARAGELAAQVSDANAKRASMAAVSDEELALLTSAKNAIVARNAAERDVACRLSATDVIRCAVRTAEAALDEAKSGTVDVPNPGVDLGNAYSELQALKEAIDEIRRYSQLKQDLDAAQAEFTRVSIEPHPGQQAVEEAEAAVIDAGNRLAAAKADLDLRQRTLGLLETSAGCECPVCRSVMDPEKAMAALKHAVAEGSVVVGAEAASLMEANSKLANAKSSESAWSRRMEAIKAIHEKADAAISKVAPPNADPDLLQAGIDERKRLIAAQKAYDDAVSGSRKRIEEAEKNLARHQARLDADNSLLEVAKARYSDAAEAAKAACARCGSYIEAVIDARISEITAARDKLSAMDRDIASFSSAHAEVQRTIKAMEATVESLRLSKDEQERRTAAMAVLQRVREWFHYQNGPRSLTTQVLNILTVDVNKFLGNFTAPFVVVPDTDSVGFRIEFTDGRSMPEELPGTDVLSGGERVQLAVAFRLAIYVMFAGKLGLLSLDEPTAYLDDSNVDRFGALLCQVKAIAKNMNVQVFMATHERSVMPHMDSVIELS